MSLDIIDFSKIRLPKEVPKSPPPEKVNKRKWNRHTKGLNEQNTPVGTQWSHLNITELQCIRIYGKKRGWDMVSRKQPDGTFHIWRLG